MVFSSKLLSLSLIQLFCWPPFIRSNLRQEISNWKFKVSDLLSQSSYLSEFLTKALVSNRWRLVFSTSSWSRLFDRSIILVGLSQFRFFTTLQMRNFILGNGAIYFLSFINQSLNSYSAHLCSLSCFQPDEMKTLRLGCLIYFSQRGSTSADVKSFQKLMTFVLPQPHRDMHLQTESNYRPFVQSYSVSFDAQSWNYGSYSISVGSFLL